MILLSGFSPGRPLSEPGSQYQGRIQSICGFKKLYRKRGSTSRWRARQDSGLPRHTGGQELRHHGARLSRHSQRAHRRQPDHLRLQGPVSGLHSEGKRIGELLVLELQQRHVRSGCLWQGKGPTGRFRIGPLKLPSINNRHNTCYRTLQISKHYP